MRSKVSSVPREVHRMHSSTAHVRRRITTEPPISLGRKSLINIDQVFDSLQRHRVPVQSGCPCATHGSYTRGMLTFNDDGDIRLASDFFAATCGTGCNLPVGSAISKASSTPRFDIIRISNNDTVCAPCLQPPPHPTVELPTTDLASGKQDCVTN